MNKQILVDVANDTQDIVLNSFKASPKNNLPKWFDSLKIVADAPDVLVKALFGITGQRLKRFAQRVNLDNPDIESYFNDISETLSTSNSAQAMYKQIADVLVAAEHGLSPGDSIEKEFLDQDHNFGKIVRLLQQPCPRILVGKEDRNTQRSNKKQVKSIGLKSVIQGGQNSENNFYGKPSHFKRFARHSPWYRQELQELNERQLLFQAKNMTEMAHVYAKTMRELEESISDTLGFYRISPHEVSVILARLHNFKWEESGSITVPSKAFESCCFWNESPKEEKSDGLDKTLILNTRFMPLSVGMIYFGYQARLYPLAGFSVPLPEKTQKIIEQTENLTNLNGSPFFDYYWVLVPSVNLNHQLIQKQKDSWTLREGDVNVVYNDYNEAALFLDQMLIKSGCIVPVIIGERDGKCYFLSMFF